MSASFLVRYLTPVAVLACGTITACAVVNADESRASGNSQSTVKYVQPPAVPNNQEPPPIAELESLLRAPVLVPALEQQVTSVARQESTVGRSAAAVYVITAEDIRRSGFRSIPEILRMAPGVNVARLESNTWAISIRGFNDEFSNKLLVLVDGREVYTPAFGGVHWDIVDTMLPDIDRIEVIRGPGGTIWDNNAVNGIINIITKRAKDTQGTLAYAGGGSYDRAFGGVRHGGRINRNTFYRLYAKGFHREDSRATDGFPPNDHWGQGRVGFRVDKEYCCDLITFQGDTYFGDHGDFDSPRRAPPGNIPNREPVFGGHALFRWTHTISDESDWGLQVYYDRQDRNLYSDDPLQTTFVRRQGLFDVDFQHRFPIGSWHNVIWGARYRFSHDKFTVRPVVSFDVDSLVYNTTSFFVQDEVELVRDRLFFTVGSKFSWNHFSGFEIQPSSRVSWIPSERFMAWASIGRAVRIPHRADNNLFTNVPIGGGGFIMGMPNRDLRSEEVVAYEMGWRMAPSDALYFDVALFYNDYDELRTTEQTIVPPNIITVRDNQMYGETYGFEVASTVQVTDRWSMKAAYSFLRSQFHLDAGSTDVTSEAGEGSAPRNQVYFRSSWDVGSNWQLDFALRYVDNVPAVDVPAYVVGDARAAWRPTDNMELSVTGYSLFDDRHPEFAGFLVAGAGSEVEHGVYGMLEYAY